MILPADTEIINIIYYIKKKKFVCRYLPTIFYKEGVCSGKDGN